MYADDYEGEYPPRADKPSWIKLLEPYYFDNAVLRCPTERAGQQRTYLMNGFNDWFETYLLPLDYDDFKHYLWPRGINSGVIREPVDTITFGEKLQDSVQLHMDFYQGVGNELAEVDHERHNAAGHGTGGSNFAFADGSGRFLRYWRSLAPRNLWAVTPLWRNAAVPESE